MLLEMVVEGDRILFCSVSKLRLRAFSFSLALSY